MQLATISKWRHQLWENLLFREHCLDMAGLCWEMELFKSYVCKGNTFLAEMEWPPLVIRKSIFFSHKFPAKDRQFYLLHEKDNMYLIYNDGIFCWSFLVQNICSVMFSRTGHNQLTSADPFVRQTTRTHFTLCCHTATLCIAGSTLVHSQSHNLSHTSKLESKRCTN